MNLPPVPGGPADPPAPPAPASSVPPAPATATDPYHGDISHWDAATRAPFMQHRLVPFETAGVVVLGILTLNIFAVVYHGLKHSRLPKVRPDDFSAGRAIGFLFIPFFNFYWIFVFWTRLAQRLNFQFKLRDQPPPVAAGLGTAIAVLTMLSFIPVLGIVTAVVNWLILIPIFSAQIQSATNQLAAGNVAPAAPPILTAVALDSAPPAAQLPPPPPPLPPAGPPLSRRTLAWIGAGVAVLVAILVVAGKLEAPADSAVWSFVKAELAREGLAVENVAINRREKGNKTRTYYTHITYRRSPEPLYEALLPEPVVPVGVPGGVSGGMHRGVANRIYPPLPDWLPLDFALWQRVRTQLASPNGVRLKQVAGLTPDDEALVAATVVREVKGEAPPASSLGYTEGTVRAVRQGWRWNFSFERPAYSAQETGSRRLLSAFRGRVLVLDRADDRAALLELAQRLPGISDRLDAAVDVLLAEAKTRWFALLQPRALFAGTLETAAAGPKQKATMYLEVTETRADQDPPRLSVLLRNDGGWQESRLFAGRVVYEEFAGRFVLKLSSPPSENAFGAGPLLDDHAAGLNLELDGDGDRVLSLLLEEGALVWKSGGATLRLTPVPEGTRAALIAGLQADQLKLQAATQPGTAYLGTITNRAKGTKESWLLRFNVREESATERGEKLAARLEHPDNRTWKCDLRVSLLANRYRANGVPLHLFQDHDSDQSPPKEITDVFEIRDQGRGEFGPEIGLQLVEGKLVGENSRFVFQFSPAPPEQVAGIEKKWVESAAAERRLLLEATRPGAIYRGTVTTRSGSKREEFLLRFVAPEDRGNTARPRSGRPVRMAPPAEPAEEALRAWLEHPEHPSRRRLLTGELALEPGGADYFPIQLSTSGEASNGNETRSRSFLDTNYEALRLRPDGTALTGESEGYRYHFQRAAPELVAQLQRRDEDARARLRAFIQPGAAHDGTVEIQNAKPGLLRLRFLRLENDGEKVEAVMESRLRPQFAWKLTGRCNLAELRLELNRSGGFGDGGSTLNADPDLEQILRFFNGSLVFHWDDNTVGGYLGSPPGGWKFSFQPSTPEQLAQQRKERAEREARLLAFVQPGALHDGTVERTGTSGPGLLRLRIVKMENRGERVEAILQSRHRPRYALTMTGKCDLAAGTLQLHWSGPPPQPALVLTAEPDLRAHFRNFGLYNGSLDLSLDGNPVTGTHLGMNFRFAPTTPERQAELQKQEADRLARALAFIQADTVHEGTITRTGGASGSVRLRILKMVNRGQRIEARLESAAQPQFAQKLTGWLALEGLLLLARLDSGPADNNGRFLFEDPALRPVYPNGFFGYNEFELVFTDTALEGSLDGNNGPKLNFPLR